MPSKEIIVRHEDFANYCLPVIRFFLPPTDDTDEHGYSIYRTRMSRIDTDDFYITKTKKNHL